MHRTSNYVTIACRNISFLRIRNDYIPLSFRKSAIRIYGTINFLSLTLAESIITAFVIERAGTPATVVWLSIFRVTTAPAPIFAISFFRQYPGSIIALAPISVLSPIMARPRFLHRGDTSQYRPIRTS